MCVRERERKRKRDREKKREREREKENTCAKNFLTVAQNEKKIRFLSNNLFLELSGLSFHFL